MACLSYLPDVKNVLGDKVVNAMINFSLTEKFPSEKLSIFAQYLSENMTIYGNHKRGNKDGADGLIAILCDWYSEELFDLPSDDALEKLITVLERADINVKPLTAEIKEIIKEPKQGQLGQDLPACSGKDASQFKSQI